MRGKKSLICLILSFILVACGGSDKQKDKSSDAAVTIKYAVYDWEMGDYESLVEAFEEEHSDINIKLVSIDETLDLGADGGQYPDDAGLRIAKRADVFPGQFANWGANVALELTSFLDEPGFAKDDFYPNVIRYVDGHVWTIPLGADYAVMIYDKDKFDAAGVEYPEIGWAWDDFRAKIKALTVHEGGDTAQWGFIPPFLDIDTFIVGRLETPLVNRQTDPPTPRLVDPDVVDAVRWYTDLFLVDKTVPIFDNYLPSYEYENHEQPPSFAAIEAGNAAIWFGTHSRMSFGEGQERNLGVVPLPSTNMENNAPVYSNGVAISAGTANPDAAWKWSQFLSLQLSPGLLGNTAPARRSVAEASGYWKDMDDEIKATLQYAIDHSRVYEYDVVNDGLITAVVDLLTGKESSVESALQAAQTLAERKIDEALTKQDDKVEPFSVVAEPDEALDEEIIELTFVSLWEGLDAHRALAEQFSAENPNIRIDVRLPDWGGESMADIIGSADCFTWYVGMVNDEERAFVLPLDPLLEADRSISADSFFPFAIDNMSHEGRLYGLPAGISLLVVEYNKEIFDAAGVAYPALDWTTDDFVEIASALASGEGEQRRYAFVDATVSGSLMLSVDQFGTPFLDDSVDPPTLNFTNLEESLRWFTELSTKYDVMPPLLDQPGQYDWGESRDKVINLIKDGKAAMWLTTMEDSSFDNIPSKVEVGVATIPTVSGSGISGHSLNMSGYFIAADSDNREASWQWLSFLMESPSSTLGFPARIDVAQSDEYRQQVGDERADVYLAINSAESQPIMPYEDWLVMPVVWLLEAYNDVIDDGVSVEDALEEAQTNFSAYRDCVIIADAFDDAKAQMSCMSKVDPDAAKWLEQ